jgi:hypothetical protein
MANPDTISITLSNPVDNLTISPVNTVDTIDVNTVSEVTSISLTSTTDVSTIIVEDAQNNLTVDINLNEGYVPVTSVNGMIGDVQLTLLQKYTILNPTLTVSSGVANWTISHGLGNNVQVELRDATTNAIIEAEVIVDSTTVTINFNSSLSTIASGTYRVVVIG